MCTKYITMKPPEKCDGAVIVIKVKDQNKQTQKLISEQKVSKPKTIIEKRKSSASTNEAAQKWFGNPKLSHRIQAQSARSIKYTENKEIKKSLDVQKQGNKHNHNKVDTVSSKRMYSQKKLGEPARHFEKPLLPSSASDTQSVLVQDRAVQYPETYDSRKFNEINPVHKLHSLLKELNDLIKKDKKTSTVIAEMEQALFRIPIGFGKSVSENLTDIMYSKLKKAANKLEEDEKDMKTMNEQWELKQVILQSQIQERDEQSKEAKLKEIDLKEQIKILTQQLEKTKAKNEEISTLEQQIKNSNGIISDLQAQINKQTELVHKERSNNENLKLEYNKLLSLCDCQEIRLRECRNTLQELKNITKNGIILDEVKKATNFQASTIHRPRSSTPNSSTSDDNEMYPTMSDIMFQENAISKEERDATPGDKYFISIPESIIQNSCIDQVMNYGAQCNENTDTYQDMNENHAITKKSLHHPLKKDYNKEDDILNEKKLRSKRRLSNNNNNNNINNNNNNNTKISSRHDQSEILENTGASKSNFDIQKHVQDVLENIQSKIPINVPSPSRDYLPSGWIENSSNLSTTSELASSNDI